MYTHHETPIPRLLGDSNYLKNHFAMYKRLERSCVLVELAFPTYLGLRIM